MNIKRFGAAAAALIAGSLVLAACSGGTEETPSNGDTLRGEITGIGASSYTVGQTNWKAAFELMHDNVIVNYDPQGSGNGRRALLEGAADFAGSDDAIKIGENTSTAAESRGAAGATALNLPLWISPIAIVFNLDGIDSLNLDADTIAAIFKGDITRWNDPVIASQNDGTTLPDLAISRVYRSDSSGTTSNFTDYLSKAAPGVWTDGRFGQWPDSLLAGTAEGADGTSGLISAVQAGVGSIGYADASRAGTLGTVAVKVGDTYVSYTAAGAAAVVGASPLESGRASNDLAVDLLRNTTDSGHYPIVLIAYTIVWSEYKDSNTAELVKEYLRYAAGNEGQALAAEKGGIAPLTGEIQQKVLAAIETIK